ncbi:MAG: cytochrome C554 [Bacteroidetes bacterium]|nr:MAG: cytochrome C554 [Bacteroidota bacterium]
MKNLILMFLLITFCMLFITSGLAQNKYVGVKQCSMCHKSDKQGKQFDIWQKSKHAEAYKVLASDKANEIAKKQGLKKPAAESPECLECHTVTADAKLLDKGLDVKDGVQCESCHGAGSAYKTMAVMKDQAKAIAAGLTSFKDEKEIEAKCVTCHNKKSPTFKEFKFPDMWAKIKHPIPKS